MAFSAAIMTTLRLPFLPRWLSMSRSGKLLLFGGTFAWPASFPSPRSLAREDEHSERKSQRGAQIKPIQPVTRVERREEWIRETRDQVIHLRIPQAQFLTDRSSP